MAWTISLFIYKKYVSSSELKNKKTKAEFNLK